MKESLINWFISILGGKVGKEVIVFITVSYTHLTLPTILLV